MVSFQCKKLEIGIKHSEKFKDWNHFAVVRQPVDRYISGLTEFIFLGILIKTLMSMLKSH